MAHVARDQLISADRLVCAREHARAHREDVDLVALERALRAEVRFDAGTRGMYALDASNYFHEPLGVVTPKTVDTCRRRGTLR